MVESVQRTGKEPSVQMGRRQKWQVLLFHFYCVYIICHLGGELISAFEKDGEDGVLKFALDKFTSMMYNDGQSAQLIKLSDFLKWRRTVVSE